MKTKEGSLIADGQGLPQLKLTFSQVPHPDEIERILAKDTEVALREKLSVVDVDSGIKSAAGYKNDLQRIIELLTNLPTQTVPLTGLVEPELAQQMAIHKKNVEKKKPSEIKSILLNAEISKVDARTIAKNFDTLIEERNNEVKKLDTIKKSIEKFTGVNFQRLDDLTRLSLKDYSGKLSDLQAEVEQEVVRLKMKQEKDLKKTDVLREEEGTLLVQKIRTTFDPVKTSFSNAHSAVEDYVESKIPQDKPPEIAFDLAYGTVNYIKSQLDMIKESLSATEKDINNLKGDWKKIEEDFEAKKKEIINKTEDEIRRNLLRITDTEAARDSKIKEIQDLQKAIENLTKELFSKIDEQKNKLIEENAQPKEFLIPESIAPMYTDASVTFVPLYFAKYTTPDNEERFIVIPPIISMTEKKELGIDVGNKKFHSIIYAPFDEHIKKRIEEAVIENKSLKEAIEQIMNTQNFMNDKTIESSIYDGIKVLSAKKIIKEKDAEELSLASVDAFRGSA